MVGDGSEVAGGPPAQETAAASASPATAPRADTVESQTMSMFGASVVELVANKEAVEHVQLHAGAEGLEPGDPDDGHRVVLSRRRCGPRTSAAKVVLQAAPQARTLSKVRVTDASGKIFHIGTLEGRLSGQVKLGDQWLLVQLPAGTVEWPDDVLRRFLASCTVN